MSKTPKSARSPSAEVVVHKRGNSRRHAVLSFGNAQLQGVRMGRVPPEVLDQSHQAMRQLVRQLLKPGVRIPGRKGVPKFYVDEADPALVVRELDGKRERGRFEDGQFKAVA